MKMRVFVVMKLLQALHDGLEEIWVSDFQVDVMGRELDSIWAYWLSLVVGPLYMYIYAFHYLRPGQPATVGLGSAVAAKECVV